MELAELDRILADPETYPGLDGVPELIHTHCSVVALVGEEVFKVKREVRYAFLDFTRPEARLEACREELRLNRRLAPGMYLGLAALVPRAGGKPRFQPFADHAEPPAGALAVAVRMKRLSAHELLDRGLERGDVDHGVLGRLAAKLATFHREAARGDAVDAAADPARLARLAADNLHALARWTASPGHSAAIATPRVLAFLSGATARFFDQHGAQLRARIAAGRAVDGHGDLHSGNVWVSDDRLLVYDALEFDADLRRADAALDLAFLLMDLDHAGHRASAAWLAREYARLAGDPDLERVLGGFKTYRALVRAKVCGLRADGASGTAERGAARAEAIGYVALAASYALAPPLVLTSGLPASGKSWFGERAARALGLALHRSDVRRRRVEAAHGAGDARYSAGAKQRTYDALLADARADLASGRGVVIDASFLQAAWRAPFVALARELGAPFALLEPRVPPDVARERLARRAHDPREPSEADWTVHEALAREAEPAVELPAGSHVVVAGDGPFEDALLALLDALVR